MSFSRIAENRIREAMAEGKFDQLARAGEPLDLDEYFRTQGPPRDPDTDEARAGDDAARQSLQRELTSCRTRLGLMLERRPR